MCGTLSKAEERGATNISSSSSTASSSSSASNLTPGGGLSSSSSPASRLQQFGVGSSSGRMPASSSDDPVSNALHMSLLANKCSTLKCNSNGSDAGEGGSGGASLDNKLVASTKRVLLTEIAFEKCNSYTSTVLDTLKSRYIVLNTNDASAAASSNGGGGKVSEQVKKTKVASEGGAKVSGEDGLPKPKIVLWSADSVQLGWQGSAPVGAGMVNLRNTCYLNSTLQALFHVPSFVNWLLNDKTHVSKCQLLNGLTHSECLICAMKSVLIAHRSTNNAIKPLQIYSKLKLICKHFVHGQQEDAHEFLRYLIESMERSYLNVVGGLKLDSYSKETTPLNQIFGGYLRTEVTCLVCGHVSTTFQHFEDLPLDIRQVSSVEAALDTYFSREQLGAAGGGDEAYKCDKCHRRVNATKKFSLQRAPNVLCLQLKRFGITGGKMSKHISLQMSLDMTRYMHASSKGGGAGGGQQQKGGRSYRYRLVSMISHIGPWSGCGHYTAMAAASNGHFYLFDDNLVRQMSVSNVLYNSNAYVMIYELEPSSAASSTSSCSSSSSLSSSSSSTASSSSSSSSPSSSSTLQQQQRSLSSPASNSSTTSASNGGNSTSKLVQNGGSSSSSSNGEASNGKSSSYFGASSASGGSSRVYGPLPPPRISDNSNSCTPSGRVYPTPATPPPPPRIATPSPHKQDNSSRASSSTTTSSSSSTTAYSMASSSSSSSSSCPSNSSSSSSPIKQPNSNCKKLNGTKQQRLVPYTTTESDDSSTEEGEEERTTLVAKRSQKFARPDCLMKKLEIDCASTASSTWHVTEVSSQQNQQHSASSISSVSSSSSSVGNWSVTESGNKVARTAGDSSSREAALPIGQLTEQHVVSGGSKWNQNGGGSEQRKTGGKMWDGSRGGEGDATVNGLLKMSHRGYGGNSGVTTWEGGRSELDQELDKDKSNEQRKQLKRNYSSYHNNSYDDDLDRGKVKKVKYNNNNNSNGNNGQRYNPFQEHQNRKMGGGNNWYGGGKRFYHNNSNGFRNNNRNNNNGSSYHRNNGFNRWRH